MSEVPQFSRSHLLREGPRVELRVPSRDFFRAQVLTGISAGTLFVRTSRPVPEGAHLAIAVIVAGAEPLSLSGVVLKLAPAGFTVKLEPLQEAQWAALARLISEPDPGGEEFEAGLLADTAKDLTARMTRCEAERRRLMEALQAARDRVRELEAAKVHAAADPDVLREELRALTAELDEERLKNLALQRSLSRFLALHGLAAPAS